MARKNAFYIMTFTQLWGHVADHMLKEHDIEPTLYVGMQMEHLSDSVLSKAAFYDVNDARMAVTPPIEGFKAKPLDPELIQSFSEHQPIIYEMMSRFLLGKTSGTFEQRRHYVWQLYRIWEGLFDTHKPDMVIAGSMPHRIFDYVVYLICQKRNIPFIALEDTSIPNLVYACDTIEDPSCFFKADRFKNKKLPDLSKDTLDYYEYVKNPTADYRPVYYGLSGMFSAHPLANQKNFKEKILALFPQNIQVYIIALKIALDGKLGTEIGTVFSLPEPDKFSKKVSRPATVLKNLQLTLRTGKTVAKSEKWYRNQIEETDYDKPYIYFPANFQPERSTVPDAGYFYDFPLIFSMLEKHIPQDWQIIYKEHPRSFRKPVDSDNPRDIEFFIRLKEACPRIKFIEPTTDSKELIKHCSAVVTARGTSGWEALARGKPILLFGDYWYGQCEGSYKIRNLSDLEQAVVKILQNPIVPEESVYEYLQRVEAVGMDLSYYFKDNVEERARLAKKMERPFTNEELKFRKDFSKKMASCILKRAANA